MNAINKPNEMSMFNVGDKVIRHFNGKVYFINHLVGDEEFLISYGKDTPVSKCQICEHISNLTIATEQEIAAGHRIEQVK